MEKTGQTVEHGRSFYEPDFPLAVRQESLRIPASRPHRHADFWDLGIVLRGQAVLNVEKQSYDLLPGDIFVIGEGQLHNYSRIRGFTCCNILMNLPSLGIPLGDLPARPGYQLLFVIDRQNTARDRFRNRFRLDPGELGHALGLVHTLKRLVPERRFEAIAQLMLLIGYLCDCAENTVESALGIPWQLSLIAAEMEKHSERKFSVEAMSRKANMSRAGFFRRFRQYYGSSPLEYLLKLRIRRGMQLLRDTALSCGEIAVSCGFADSSYFALHFRRQTGMSPREYRRAAGAADAPVSV